jgi:hypothetical protein
MICREQGYLSDSARELIKVVRSFNGEMWRRTPRVARTQSAKSIATA